MLHHCFVYYWYCILRYETMQNHGHILHIKERLNTPGQLGVASHIGMDDPFYNDRPIIVIAIGDDYRFAFFGLVTKLWLKFRGLFY